MLYTRKELRLSIKLYKPVHDLRMSKLILKFEMRFLIQARLTRIHYSNNSDRPKMSEVILKTRKECFRLHRLLMKRSEIELR